MSFLHTSTFFKKLQYFLPLISVPVKSDILQAFFFSSNFDNYGFHIMEAYNSENVNAVKKVNNGNSLCHILVS